LIDPADVAVLLLDRQSGLFQNVKDVSITGKTAATRRRTSGLGSAAGA